jgi:hypothetical protein
VDLSPDHEVVGFILSQNVNRRHLSAGQRAMAVAVAYPEPEKGGRGKKRLGDLNPSAERLSLARTVPHFAPDLVDAVRAGGETLEDKTACGAAMRLSAS